MLRSLFSGVSGIRSYQLSLDVIADNIANVNTTGFKAARTTFRSLFSQLLQPARGPMGALGGVNPRQVGLGVMIGSTDTLFTQGAPQATGRATDLAINGSGFFILTDGEREFYTRSGNFSVDSDGNLVYVNGMQVKGWQAIDGVIDRSRLEALRIPVGAVIPAKATSQVQLTGLVDSRTTDTLQIPLYTLRAADGSSRSIQFEVVPTGNFDEWSVQAKWADTGQAIVGLSGTWRSDANGTLLAPSTAGSAMVGVGDSFFLVQGPSAGVALTGPLFTVVDSRSLSFPDLAITDGVSTVATVAFAVTAKSYDAASQRYTWEWTATHKETGQVIATGTVVTDSAGTVVAPPAPASPFQLVVQGVTVTVQPPDVTAGLQFTAVPDPASGWPPSQSTGQQQPAPAQPAHSGTFQTAPPVLRSLELFDSLGNRRSAVVALHRIGNTQWTWTLTDPSRITVYGNGTLTFGPDGKLVSGLVGTATIPGVGGASDMQVQVDLSHLLQASSDSSVALLSQDGYASGKLVDLAIDDAGVIKGSFSNGILQDLGQVALATFANQEALIRRKDTLFEASPNVGVVNVDAPGSGSAGSLIPGFLEMSNVDLSQEFSALIMAQRALQANSRTVTVSDEVLQELVNLRR